MSAAQAAGFNNGAGAGKKAVHVKWAGKTIALGTFPSAEADEKCARAKALTRAWRSTMRPKPTRDWVMVELERLGVRVVSGRLGRKAGEDDEIVEKKSSAPLALVGGLGGGSAQVHSQQATGLSNTGWSSNAELDNIMQQRRSSSLGLSMMNDRDFNRRGSLNSLGPVLGFDSTDPAMPPHRPLVGSGSAAAYEAARADHYAQKREEQQRRASGLGLSMGGGGIGGGGMQMGLSVNPNQHYEMLKLHHMNLLNEIQETTLMMNLYQQQQLQQQQQQLQQQQASVMQDLSTGSSRRGSMTVAQEPAPAPRLAAKSSAPAPAHAEKKKTATVSKKKALASSSNSASLQEELLKGQREQEELEKRLKRLKDDIARREKEAEELQKKADAVAEAAARARAAKKRSAEENAGQVAAKNTSGEDDPSKEAVEPGAKKMKTKRKGQEDEESGERSSEKQGESVKYDDDEGASSKDDATDVAETSEDEKIESTRTEETEAEVSE